MGCACASLSSCLEEVPVEIREWKPEHAPQGREQGSDLRVVDHRKLEGGSAGECGQQDAEDGDDHHRVKQEAGQIVTRLQHDPHRDQGSDGDVSADQDDPCGSAQSEAEVHADGNDGDDADDACSGSRAGLDAELVGCDTIEDGQDDEQNRDHRGGLVSVRIGDETGDQVACLIRLGVEGAGNDIDEGSDDQDQDEQREDDEQLLCSLAHGIFDDLTDRLAAMSDRCEQRTEILKAAEENAADDAPQENREPSENGCLDRAVDRACAGDG